MSVQQQIDKLIAVTAAQWYDKICSDEKQSSSEAFRRWLGESPRHVDAFLTIAGQAPLIREVFQSGRVEVQERDEPSPTALFPLDPAPFATHGSRSVFTRSAWIALAAGIAVAGWMLWASPHSQHLETAIGEQRAVSLADGSVVNLNARSAVAVRLSPQARDLHLTQGEALFKVAHDKQRPFRVHTPTAVVQAIGTEFAVSIRHRMTLVTVIEGKVEVAPESGAGVTPISAGQEAQVAGNGAVKFEPHADVTASTSWLRRKLVFRRTLLEDMVPEINRYNGAIQLHLDGVTPGVYRFNGTFDANDPLSLADLLAREPGLAVEHRGTDIFIRESNRGNSRLRRD